MNAMKTEHRRQKPAEIHVVQNYERERNDKLKTLNQSVENSLILRANAIEIKHSSRWLTSELRISLVGRLEWQIGHLQKAGMRLDETRAEFVGKLKQGIRVVQDPTKAMFHSNWKFMSTLQKTGMNLLSKEAT
jgi:hypothetical protein